MYVNDVFPCSKTFQCIAVEKDCMMMLCKRSLGEDFKTMKSELERKLKGRLKKSIGKGWLKKKKRKCKKKGKKEKRLWKEKMLKRKKASGKWILRAIPAHFNMLRTPWVGGGGKGMKTCKKLFKSFAVVPQGWNQVLGLSFPVPCWLKE